MTSSVLLTVGDERHELPLVEGSDQARAVDVRTLRARSGLVILDEGLGSTAACRSAITYLDGERGVLPLGQVAGLVHDVPTVAAVIERIVAEAGAAQAAAAAKVA